MLERDIEVVAQADARLRAAGGATYPLLRVVELQLEAGRSAELAPGGRLRRLLETYRAWMERQNGLLGSNLYSSIDEDAVVEVRAQTLWRTPEDLLNYLAAPQALERVLAEQPSLLTEPPITRVFEMVT